MKNLGKGMLLFAALTTGLASCSDESPWKGSDYEGGINLNFSSDSRVMRQTRADDQVSPIVPDGKQFAVQLVKSDGSYSQKWSGVEAFNKETAFPIGDYTLTASYGSLDAEGFTAPYFLGSTTVHVSPGATTDANVVATLANAMVSVRYTDDFKDNFTAYSAAVQSEGHDKVVFAQNEDRPAFVSPSTVKLDLTMTNLSGQEVTIQPAQFEAVARHHYVVTIGVKGEASGDLALDIAFDDDVVAETVEVALGDELFTAPAPSLKAIGFTDGETVEAIEFAKRTAKTGFDIFAFGGLRSVSLNVVSSAFTPTFGATAELVNANSALQSQLQNSGVVCAGLFRNVDKMAQVDITDFIGKLPAGNYKIQLQAVDNMTRTTEPLTLNVSLETLQVELSSQTIVEFMGNDLTVDLVTNSRDVRDQIRFKVPNANNQMVDAEIKSVMEISTPPSGANTRANGSYKFRFTLGLEPQIRTLIDVIAIIGDKQETLQVPMQTPSYTMTPDAYARKVIIKVDGEDDDKTALIMKNIQFYNGSSPIPTSNVSMSGNYATISGLTPGIDYVAIKAKLGDIEQAVPMFTTENETDVTNGDFSSLGSAINIEKINVGGEFKISFVVTSTSQAKSTISYREPTGWATINEKTCYKGSANRNTWYMVPSTFDRNGATLLRTVGYSHNGPTVPASTSRTTYYCVNSPADADLVKAAGELFLGSYSFDGSEHRVDGIAFNSRPSSLSFDYTYSQLAGTNEKGEVYIKVKDETGAVISEKTAALPNQATLSNVTLSLPNYPFGKKAASIELGFSSVQRGVAPKVHIPTGSELYESDLNSGNYLTNPTINTNNYHALATGSVLTVDNVKLGYGVSNGPATKPAKSNKR